MLDGTVSVAAEGTPLGTLLKGLGEKGRFNKLVVDPKVESRPVTVTIERVQVSLGGSQQGEAESETFHYDSQNPPAAGGAATGADVPASTSSPAR